MAVRRRCRGRPAGLVWAAIFLSLLHLLPLARGTVYFVPGLHSPNERYGVIAREQPPSGESGALHAIKRSRVDVVRLPASKIVSQARRDLQSRQTKPVANENALKPKEPECSSLTGPFCFQSFDRGLAVSPFASKFSLQGVHEVSEESLQLAILSSPGDVLILFYSGQASAEHLELRAHFAKAGSYLDGQVDVAAVDCGAGHGGSRGYCHEASEAGAQPVLKHFRRLSDSFYTIHSKTVRAKEDLSIHETIEFLRGPATASGLDGEDPRRGLQNSDRRMLVVRNRSTHTVEVVWAIQAGKERTYYELVPGASQLVNVHVNQKWLIKEKGTKLLIKDIVVTPDMSLGGVTLHIVTDEAVQSIKEAQQRRIDEMRKLRAKRKDFLEKGEAEAEGLREEL